MTTKNLLVELFVEELPPKALKRLGEAFAAGVADSLKAQGLAAADAEITAFASPRRLAVHVTQVLAQAADKTVCNKLMPVAVALDANGQATPALLKKLAALGLDASVVPHLRRAPDGKAVALFHDSVAPGVQLAEGLQKALDEALAKLPIPKVMGYQLHEGCAQPGWSTVNFVRPAHGLVALHGDAVVPVSVLGLSAGNTTRGHRFEASAPSVLIRDADQYEAQLEGEGAVIPGFDKRRAEILRQMAAAAERIGGGVRAIEDDALLDEVTALVEHPNVLLCQFDAEFLEVPQECLILTMKANQKYFPLLEAGGRLTHQFLIVSNIRPADPSAVIGGNERVVRPRLADAKFFFDQDRKKSLASRVEALDRVVYHNKLGSQGARTQRVSGLARDLAEMLGQMGLADSGLAEVAVRAATLAKADLLTDMVGEFPELQGVMGRYYALHDGEAADVADAIEDHYKPRFAGDSLPRNAAGVLVALADKLESLVGIFGIGLIPTGDKDPFALRRAALGVLRMLMERALPLDLMLCLERAQARFTDVQLATDGPRLATPEPPPEGGKPLLGRPGERLASSTALDVFQFMQDRLRVYLRDQGYAADEVESVVAQQPRRVDNVPARLEAVRRFRALPEAEALAAANKRIRNILKKTEAGQGAALDVALLTEVAERELHAALLITRPEVDSALQRQDYGRALTELAGLRTAVDRFFDDVMVMADDPAVRDNRLALLRELARLMEGVADISQLALKG